MVADPTLQWPVTCYSVPIREDLQFYCAQHVDITVDMPLGNQL